MSIQKRAWFSVEEIIHKYCEHKEENMEKNKPLSEWTLSESKAYCEEFRKSVPDSGVCEETPGCILREKGICKAANTWPHLWDLNRLNEQELAICKAIDAMYLSLESGDNFVKAWMDKPGIEVAGDGAWIHFTNGGNLYSFIAKFRKDLFPSVHPGDMIKVP